MKEKKKTGAAEKAKLKQRCRLGVLKYKMLGEKQRTESPLKSPDGTPSTDTLISDF
jgi:hypothetical protein